MGDSTAPPRRKEEISGGCSSPEADCVDVGNSNGINRIWFRIAVAAIFAGQSMVLSLALNMTPPEYGSEVYLILHSLLAFSSLVVFLFLGQELMRSCVQMIRLRRFSIDGLFMLSLLGAFGGSLLASITGKGAVFYEVVSVVIAIHTIGRLLSERSMSRLQGATHNLGKQYGHAEVLRNNLWEVQAVASLKKGELVRVKAGQPISVDGIIVEGVGYVNECALSGEPLPIVRRAGDRVRAGTQSVDGAFEIQNEALFGERTLDAILELLKTRVERPSLLQSQANRLILYFLPLVASMSILTGIVWFIKASWMDAVFNSMAVLLVACPCALGLATPLAIWRGLYQFAQSGMLSRDGAFIDVLAQTRTIFFDKTGTLTESAHQVVDFKCIEEWQSRREELLGAVSLIESKSTHPIAASLVKYIGNSGFADVISQLEIFPGEGIGGDVEGLSLKIGEATLVKNPSDPGALNDLAMREAGKRIFVFLDNTIIAVFVLKEIFRAGVSENWKVLQDLGIQMEVLTGDPEPQLNFPETIAIHAGMLAGDKAERVRVSARNGDFPIFVGDGINDSAAMKEADAAIAMGSGEELAQSTAQALLVSDRVSVLPELIQHARAIQSRLKANLYYAVAYNSIGMLLAAFGWLHPVVAAVIMLGSSLFVLARSTVPFKGITYVNT